MGISEAELTQPQLSIPLFIINIIEGRMRIKRTFNTCKYFPPHYSLLSNIGVSVRIFLS